MTNGQHPRERNSTWNLRFRYHVRDLNFIGKATIRFTFSALVYIETSILQSTALDRLSMKLLLKYLSLAIWRRRVRIRFAAPHFPINSSKVINDTSISRTCQYRAINSKYLDYLSIYHFLFIRLLLSLDQQRRIHFFLPNYWSAL